MQHRNIVRYFISLIFLIFLINLMFYEVNFFGVDD
jgi:hypothetical protein